MGELMRSKDWSASQLGETETWPRSLKTTLSLLLSSQFPMFLWWGADLICFYNDAYRPSLGEYGKHPAILGMPAAKAWPEIWDVIKPLIDQVLNTGEATWSEDQLIPIYRNGNLEDVYWTFSYSPAHDDDDQIAGVLVTCTETTGKIKALNQAIVNQQNLLNTVKQAPVGMCIVRGKPLMVVEVNDLFLQIIGKEREVFNTTPYWVVNAEAAAYYEPITDHVLTTGETYHANEHEIMLIRNGIEEIVHVDFVYEPIKDIQGEVEAIMIVAIEVTDKVAARRLIESASSQLAATNEELAASNEEMLSSNEELIASNEELAVTNIELSATQDTLHQTINKLAASETSLLKTTKDLGYLNDWVSATNENLMRTQHELEAMIEDLRESDQRFRHLVQQAPVAIFILKGRELQIEVMNTRMLKMLGKDAAVVGKTYIEAMPEFKGQPFFQLLEDVFISGESFYGNEVRANIERGGEIDEGYYNFIYEPVKDEDGVTDSIMCVAIDVTEQVKARKRIEHAEESLRLAIDAAELASYYIDLNNRNFVASPRLKEFFGYLPQDEVPYQAAIDQIHPDYRQAAADLVEKAINDGVKFDMEYPVVGHKNGIVRWVRGVGTVQNDNSGKPRYFTGLLHDITEKKQDDLRKSDFIGMVSHELKTPLTSLTAIIQLVHSKLAKSEDKFLKNAMESANTQVKKMGSMINGFLNISRLESGKLYIDKQKFDLEGLIIEVIKEQEITVKKHAINYVHRHPVMVYADRDKISSVLTNLINNAIKYSPAGQVVEIGCITSEDDVTVSIRDDGIGIKPADLQNVFKRYFRATSNHNHLISGFGIGLYLSTEIIERHEGKIWADSISGKGSTFYFSLPLLK